MIKALRGLERLMRIHRRTSTVLVVSILIAVTASYSLAHEGKFSGAMLSESVAQVEDVAALLREATALLESGKFDDAEPLIRRAVNANARNPDAHNLLGVVLDKKSRNAEAEREYLEAIRLNPRAVSARANLGILLARTNRLAEAVEFFEGVLRDVPDHPQATLNLGVLQVARGDFARAAPLLERANLLRPNTFVALYNLGVAHYELKNLDEAERAFKSAEKIAPKDPKPLFYLGLIADARGKGELAAELLEEALSLRADFSQANFMLAEVLRKNGRVDASREYYERALAEDASKLVYYVRLGGVYMLQNLYSQALEVFQRGAERFPDVAQAHYFVGIAARGRASYDISEAALRKSLSLQADNPDTLAQLGFIVGELGKYDEAEKLLRRAVELSNNHYYAQYDLGRIRVKTRRYDEAIPVLEAAALLKPNHPGVHYQLFLAFTRVKRKDDGARELSRFMELDEARKKRPRDDDDAQNVEAEPLAPTDPATNAKPKTP